MEEATPETAEKKSENAEKGADAATAEKEKVEASTKGAKEAYGAPKNGGGKIEEETVFGVSAKKEDWTKVDDSTFQTKDGDTWSLVDNEKGGSLLYGQNDWNTLFNWSSAEREASKSGSTDNWLSSLGFDILGSSDKSPKEETQKPEDQVGKKSLLDSLTDLEWKDVTNFFSDIFTSDSKEQPKTEGGGKQADNSISLPDGTKVATDGSWVQLSPELAKQAAEAGMDKPIVHKYTDTNGKEASLEVSEGRVFQVAGDGTRTEVTDKRITVSGTDGTVTAKDKETGEVRAENAERGISYQHGKDGSTVTIGDYKITRQGDQFVVVDGENNTQTLTPEELKIQFGKRSIAQRTVHDQTGEPPKAPDNPDQVETNSSGVAFRDTDGSTIGVNIAKRLVSIRLNEGPEILIDRHGQVRFREGTGEPQALDKQKLPHGLTVDEDGNIRLKNGMIIGQDGRLHTKRGDTVDSRTGDVTVKDESTGKSVTVQTSDNGTSTITDDKGREISKVNPNSGEVVTKSPGGEPIIYNTRTREIRCEDAKDPGHPLFVMGPNGDRLWDGTEVGPNGEVIFANGTYIDEEGNIRFYDGTEVDADGEVKSADGKTFSSHEGAKTSSAAIASYADALASSIAGKSNPAPGDIAALQAALGVLGSLLPALTNAGAMDAYAKLKDSQGNILQALSAAQGKGNDPRRAAGRSAGQIT